MQQKVLWLVAPLMILIGAYMLSASIGSIEENISLMSGHQLPYSIAVTLGLVGLAGGVLSFLGLFTKRKNLA